jgi:hypothetical protein
MHCGVLLLLLCIETMKRAFWLHTKVSKMSHWMMVCWGLIGDSPGGCQTGVLVATLCNPHFIKYLVLLLHVCNPKLMKMVLFVVAAFIEGVCRSCKIEM